MTRIAYDAVALEAADHAARLLRRMRTVAEKSSVSLPDPPAALAEAEAIAAWARAEIAKAAAACDRLELLLNQP